MKTWKLRNTEVLFQKIRIAEVKKSKSTSNYVPKKNSNYTQRYRGFPRDQRQTSNYRGIRIVEVRITEVPLYLVSYLVHQFGPTFGT